jgi:hypothetical protein
MICHTHTFRIMEKKHGNYFVLFHLMVMCFKELLHISSMEKHENGRLHISLKCLQYSAETLRSLGFCICVGVRVHVHLHAYRKYNRLFYQ